MSKVFVKKVKPGNIVKSYQKLTGRLLDGVKPQPIIIKLNLSWTKFYPACSSPPWQFEGVVKGLLDLGFSPDQIIPVENKTVVTDVYQGAINHGWTKVCEEYGVKFHYLTDEKYIEYEPKSDMLSLDEIFPDGILLPKIIFNKPLISLSTLKTHVFTTTTGSIKNYFGMLNTKRHWAHRFIHEAIIDLLQIQKEIHPRIAALMDGTVVGYGSGPRAMEWDLSNLILGSNDKVALDSVAAKIIGFNPQQIKYLKLGNKLKLGKNNIKEIKIKGVKRLPNYSLYQNDTLASKGQKLIYHKFPQWLEKLLLQSFLVPWSYLASRAFHDWYWYPVVGTQRIKNYSSSPWGKFFKKYQSS
jgi:uncharacterized protein (DUF362 family)